ncbi:lactonase family protein [Rhizobium leguminosarum]|uniref:lactonase family protein n=1 Tax=Rhizobium leguminosarum TaxID=384 RepID=UPI0013C23068|nr:lactonase family protein [Rhizobium leguminosarum]NEI03058.1 beta-propeller fold lactonase family protein [Rhizobium leguminosarum]NEJ47476.1 beta-propeller fold lactonase family protein [Rhizobium leguminosarum]NEJ54425.1 beta-propeller fold lactonase family protein [Rhizobium leguminosarum]NEJ82117.1 beta-propeller fold lactonase family protein [Rhizobium leguminosarum]
MSFAYVGCRTTRERNARGKGISVYKIDDVTGDWALVQLEATDPNPSFLTLHPRLDILYAVHGDLDLVTSYAIDPENGYISLLNRQTTQGRNPVHLALDPSQRWLIIPNYRTDSIVSLPVSQSGDLGSVAHLLELTGTLGPHRNEQNYGRPHHVPFSPSGKWIVVPAKGFDQIICLALDRETGELTEVSRVGCRETSGPRHIGFAPRQPLAYVLNELDSTITTYRLDDETGSLEPVDIVSSLPRGFTGNSRASEITVSADGGSVYASNRGHDTIAVLKVAADGRLEGQSWTSTQGSTPRFFALNPREDFLYVANEDSDTIVEFERRLSGELFPTNRTVATGSPTSIVFNTPR